MKIVTRQVTKEDRATNSYFTHMAGLAGTITHFYNKDEVAVSVDPEAFTPTLQALHKEGVKRMRLKLLENLSEEQKRKLTKEEKQFDANYVLIVHSDDLEKGPPAPKPAAKPKDEDEEEDLENFDPTSIKQGVLYDDPEVAGASFPRRTLAEIEAEEQAELERRKN